MPNIHFKTAWQHVRRSPFQALAAIVVLTVTFFVITVISILVYSSSVTLKYFETRPQLIAFLKEDAKAEEISTLRDKLDNDARIKKVSYISKEDALEIYKGATSDNPLLSELVSPSIFPASLELSLTDISHAEEVISELEGEGIVDQVGFTATVGFGRESIQDALSRLRTVTNYIRIGGGVFALLLVSTSFLVLLVIVSLRITTRRNEVEILNLIGATPGFIRSPIVIEALLYVTCGVLIGWAASIILVLYATPSVISYFGEIPVLPRDTLSLFYIFGIILAIELIFGWVLAVFGSMVAVARAGSKK